MTEQERISVDPNIAELEDLDQLPGVGPEMAERILAARPFESADDMTRVSGIGPTVLARMRPFLAPSFNGGSGASSEDEEVEEVEAIEAIPSAHPERERVEVKVPERSSTFETGGTIGEEDEEGETVTVTAEEAPAVFGELPAPEETLPETEAAPLIPAETETEPSEEPAAVAAEAESDEEQAEATIAPAEQKETPAPERETRPSPGPRRGLTRSYIGWMIGVGGLLALILAVAISLGVLAALNDGQLQFVRPGEFGQLQVQVEGLQAQADVLEQDVDSLRTRLNNLEALSGRVGELEQVAEELRGDLDGTQSSVESLGEDVNALEGELTDLTGQLEQVRGEMSDLTAQLEAVSGEVEALQAQSDRFQDFFDGLRDLVTGLFQPEGGTE